MTVGHSILETFEKDGQKLELFKVSGNANGDAFYTCTDMSDGLSIQSPIGPLDRIRSAFNEIVKEAS